jgi:hypothetical protein
MGNNGRLKIEPVQRATAEDAKQMFILLCEQYAQMGEQLKVMSAILGQLIWTEEQNRSLEKDKGVIDGD